jgi:hypothetical protein
MSENIIWELLEEDFVESYLNENLNFEVKLLSITAFKKQIWLTTYHVVFRYTVEVEGVERQIFVTAHDHEPRQYALKSLEYLIARGFGKGNLLVPQPLFYDARYNATFYFGLEGNNVYHYIKDNLRTELEKLVAKTALWFVKLHSLSAETGLELNVEHGRIRTIAPGADVILSLINLRYPQYIHQYNEFYRYFIETEEREIGKNRNTLIHGDAHPENIIRLNSGQIGVIDFVDMTIGDPMRDVASFLQQLDYMGMRKIGDRAYVDKIKNIFLTTYLKHAKLNLTDEIQKRLDLYYYWTSIRTATFFLMKHDPEPDRAEPLIALASEMFKFSKISKNLTN